MITSLCTSILRLIKPSITPSDVIQKQLKEAKLNYLTHLEHSQYHQSMVLMLENRVAVLQSLAENERNTYHA